MLPIVSVAKAQLDWLGRAAGDSKAPPGANLAADSGPPAKPQFPRPELPSSDRASEPGEGVGFSESVSAERDRERERDGFAPSAQKGRPP